MQQRRSTAPAPGAAPAVWMELSTVKKEIDNGQIELIGDPALASSMQQWLGLSPFA